MDGFQVVAAAGQETMRKSGRLDPKTDRRPDPGPTGREDMRPFGDLPADFDFDQSPKPPRILPVSPDSELMPAGVAGKGAVDLSWPVALCRHD